MSILSRFNRKYTLTPKALYVAISMQYYTLHKFRPMFAKEMFGIEERELGAVGILLFMTFFTNVFLATMNDRFGRPKAFLVSLLSLSCLFFQLFYVDGYAKGSRVVFWANLFAYLATNTPILALLDKVILDYLSTLSDIESRAYGKQRIWGTVGYLISIFAVEGVIGKEKTGNKADFTNLRYYSLATTLISAALVIMLLGRSKNDRGASSRGTLSEWKELMRNGEYLFFIFIILLNGFTRAAMTIYLPVYIKYVLAVKPYELPEAWPEWVKAGVGAFNNFPFSTITLFEISLEMGILFYSQAIIRRIGLLWPLLLAQVAQAIRFALYLALPRTNPHVFVFCCAFEILKGINFGLSHGSGVQLAEKMCPPHLKATSQMIYNGTFTALGSVTAGLFFRHVFRSCEGLSPEDALEARVLSFRMFFICNILVAAVSIGLFFFKYEVRDGKLGMLTSRKKVTQQTHNEGSSSKQEVSKKAFAVN